MRLEVNDASEESFNLTPLIDVVFLLLVFFLVATTFADEEVEMDLQLPDAASGEAGGDNRQLVISIAENGAMRVAGREVTMEGLRQRLRAEAQRDDEQEVQIRGDIRVHFGLVAEALDACRTASLSRVSIAALPAGRGGGTRPR